jgi:putative effector of murein hydrolase
MNETVLNLYTTFINSPFFGLSLSIFTYQLGLVLNRKWKHPLTHPLLVSIISCCLFLGFTKIPYPQYYIGGSIIAAFLGPATAILSVSMYEQLETLKKNILPILVGTIVGSFTAISSIILMGRWFNLDWTIILCMIPKSVTTAIGLSISEAFDGIPAITVAGIIITGNFGALVCPSLTKLFKIKNPVAVGVAMGTCSHVTGTTKALEIGEVEGAMSGLAIGCAGIATVLWCAILPLS